MAGRVEMAPLSDAPMLSESSDEAPVPFKGKTALLIVSTCLVGSVFILSGRRSLLRGDREAFERLDAEAHFDCHKNHFCKLGPNDQTTDAQRTVQIAVLSHDACKNACSTNSGCSATEWRSSEQRCELHTMAVQALGTESYGYMHTDPLSPAEFTCCLKRDCSCQHGHPVGDAQCPEKGQEKCERCDPGYYLHSHMCKACSAFTNSVHSGNLVVTQSNHADLTVTGKVTEVTGDLIIENLAGVAKLDGFSCLAKIGGDLLISNNPDLEGLDYAFPSLETAVNVRIQQNPKLKSMIHSFAALSTVSDNMLLQNNDLLSHLDDSFGSLSSIADSLYFQNNAALSSVDGVFVSLSNIEDTFYFQNNGDESAGWKLTNAFPNLAKVGDSMFFQNNEHLTEVTGSFQALTHVGDTLYVQNMEHLAKFTGSFNKLKATSLAPGETSGSFYIRNLCESPCSGLEIQGSFNSMMTADKFIMSSNEGLRLITSSFNAFTHTEGGHFDISTNSASLAIEDSFAAGLQTVDGYLKIEVGMSCLPKQFNTLNVNHAPGEEFSIGTAAGTYDRSNFTEALCP